MSGVYDTFDYRPEAMLPRPDAPPADSRDQPSLAEQLFASGRTVEDEVGGVQEKRLNDGYGAVEQALGAMGVSRESLRRKQFDYWGLLPAPAESRPRDFEAIWGAVEAARERDPKAFSDIPKTRDEFERNLLRRRGARDADQALLGRGTGAASTVTQFAGAMGGSFTDPVNIALLPLGGGGKTIAAQILREGLLNATIEAAQTPDMIRNRAAMGEETSARDVAFNIATAGVAGAAFKAAHVGGAAAIDRLTPLDVKVARALSAQAIDRASEGEVARAFAQGVPAEIRHPDEQAALHVIERGAAIDASNPFAARLDALDAHTRKVEETIADFHEPSGAGFVPRPADAVTPREPPRAGGNLDARIVAGLRARGFPEHVVRGVAAGIHAESASNPLARNGESGALGIGQWLGSRQAAIVARYGEHPTLDQQLDFIAHELRGGDPGGKAVLAQANEAAVLDAYIRRFMRPAAGAETSGDLQRGMAALGRAGEVPQSGGGAVDLELPAVRPAALDAERPRVDYDGREVPLESFAPAEIGVDAGLMQFKSGGDVHGVTDRLRGVQQWDPIAAGTVTVWEGLDGRRLIADGHQRLGLANRLAAENPGLKLNAFVLREADGFSAADARILTALKNIGEGTGSAVDAAKVLREVAPGEAEAVLRRLPPRSALVRDGKDLARLSDEAFGAVVNEVIPDAYGAAIARYAPDPATHMALVDLLYRADPPNRRQAEAIVRQAVDAGFSKDVQDELFGARELTTATIIQKARVIDRTLSELRKLKGAFSVAARNADALDAAGNRIDVGASEAAADGNAQALALVESLALRKGNGVNALITEATNRLVAGEPLAAVVRDVVAGLRGLDLERALREAGDAGDGPGGGGRAGEPDREDPQDALAPADQDEGEAAQPLDGSALEPSLFGDSAPARPLDATADVQAAADSVWHDLRAASPLRGENVTGKPQDGTMGSPLFDAANEPSFDLGDGRGERKLSEISDELDAFDAGIASIKDCL